MVKFDYDPQFNLQVNCQIALPVDPGAKFEFLSEFSKVYNKYEPMDKWMNDPNVPQEQKDKFQQEYRNSYAGLNFIYGMAKVIGIKDEELQEYTKIPF